MSYELGGKARGACAFIAANDNFRRKEMNAFSLFQKKILTLQ
jgi:hypothetical protein